MAKKLLIDLNLSGLNHMFILEDKNIQPVRFGILDDIKTSVYSLLDAENISDILLTGQQSYAEGVGEEILSNITTKYSDRNVRIYINDKIFN